MDPSDVNGETGHVRTINATPDQIASLKAMLDSGEIVLGKTALIHGQDAEFDGTSLHVPEDLSITKSIHRRDLTALFAGTGGEDYAPKRQRGGNPNGNSNKDYIVTFSSKDSTGPGTKCQALARANGGTVGHVYTKVMNGCSATLPKAAANALKGNPNIASIEEDGVVTASAVASWGLDRINQMNLPLDDSNTKVDASGVRVYIVDTGVYPNHDDFAGVLDPSSTCHFTSFSDQAALEDGHGHG